VIEGGLPKTQNLRFWLVLSDAQSRFRKSFAIQWFIAELRSVLGNPVIPAFRNRSSYLEKVSAVPEAREDSTDSTVIVISFLT